MIFNTKSHGVVKFITKNSFFVIILYVFLVYYIITLRLIIFKYRVIIYNKHKYCVKGFAMATTKIRSNLYLDKELKEKAKEIFKEYGLSLSDGINMLLSRVVKNKELIVPKELDIEPIDKNDPDYKLVEKTRGEETISLEEFMKL